MNRQVFKKKEIAIRNLSENEILEILKNHHFDLTDDMDLKISKIIDYIKNNCYYLKNVPITNLLVLSFIKLYFLFENYQESLDLLNKIYTDGIFTDDFRKDLLIELACLEVNYVHRFDNFHMVITKKWLNDYVKRYIDDAFERKAMSKVFGIQPFDDYLKTWENSIHEYMQKFNSNKMKLYT